MGGTKAAGNYSPVLVTQLEAKRHNYAGVCGCQWGGALALALGFSDLRLGSFCVWF